MLTLQLISNALYELNTLAQGETPDAATGQFCLQRLNDMLDEMAAAKRYCYSQTFNLFTLVANLSPHTIGPTGTFTAAGRPSKILGATLVLNTTTPDVDLPLNPRNDQWWNLQRVKELASNVPTDLYYEPDFPNGSLYFWPVPNFAYQVRLEYWTILQAIPLLTTPLVLPPGYSNYLTLRLAVLLAPAFGTTPSQATVANAMRAERIIEGNNIASPTTTTAEAGQSGRIARPDFNYLTGNLTGSGN